jgi:hypothetical protein
MASNYLTSRPDQRLLTIVMPFYDEEGFVLAK